MDGRKAAQKMVSYYTCSVCQSPKKNNLKECVFVNSALKMQCCIVKNTLLQTAFLAIVLTGWYRLLVGVIITGEADIFMSKPTYNELPSGQNRGL